MIKPIKNIYSKLSDDMKAQADRIIEDLNKKDKRITTTTQETYNKILGSISKEAPSSSGSTISGHPNIIINIFEKPSSGWHLDNGIWVRS